MRADGHPMVGVGHRVESFLDVPGGHPVGTVLVTLAALVLDHVPLDVESLLVQGVQEKPHSVGFQPQGQFQVIGGDVLPVVGAVGSGGAVEVGPCLLERVEVAVVMVA